MVKQNIDTKTIIVISDDDDDVMIGKRKARDDETNRPQTYKTSKNGQLLFPNGNGRKIEIEETSCHPHISTRSCPTTRSKKTHVARNQPCSSTASSGPSTSQPLHSQSSDERLGTRHKNTKRSKKRKNNLKGKDPVPRQHKNKKDKSTPPGEHPAGSSSTTTMRQELTPTGEKFEKFSHIIFVDLDNWGKFFDLTNLLPNVFVWGFCGGEYSFKAKKQPLYKRLVEEGRFVRHPKCGKSKNAADFALCVQAARLDLTLPVHIPFTVLSGDKGFNELQTQLSSSAREIHLVDPHEKGAELLMAILNSIEQQ